MWVDNGLEAHARRRPACPGALPRQILTAHTPSKLGGSVAPPSTCSSSAAARMLSKVDVPFRCSASAIVVTMVTSLTLGPVCRGEWSTKSGECVCGGGLLCDRPISLPSFKSACFLFTAPLPLPSPEPVPSFRPLTRQLSGPGRHIVVHKVLHGSWVVHHGPLLRGGHDVAADSLPHLQHHRDALCVELPLLLAQQLQGLEDGRTKDLLQPAGLHAHHAHLRGGGTEEGAGVAEAGG